MIASKPLSSSYLATTCSSVVLLSQVSISFPDLNFRLFSNLVTIWTLCKLYITLFGLIICTLCRLQNNTNLFGFQFSSV